MNTALIRKAKDTDIPAIISLTEELLDSIESERRIEKRHAITNCATILQEPHCVVIVAELNRTVVGFIVFTLQKTLLHQGLSGVITELVVTQKYRGKGIGTQLIGAAIERCTQLGCCEIEVSTEPTNKNARRLYQRCGFEERGILYERDL
jgi:ribosomal protein S18 acetylase RimI-like enzyme